MAPAAGTIHIKIQRFVRVGGKMVPSGVIMGQFAYTAGAQNADVYPIQNQWWVNVPANEVWLLQEFMIINAAYTVITFELIVGGIQVFPWGSKGHYSAYSGDYVQRPQAVLPGGTRIHLRLQDATA